MLGFAMAAQATESGFLQLEARLIEEPYQWFSASGKQLIKGLSDEQARVRVMREPGQERYLLRMLYGDFPVQVPAHCWKAPVFDRCVKFGKRRDTPEQQADAQQEQTHQHERQARRAAWAALVAWVPRQLGQESPSPQRLVMGALEQQAAWLAGELQRVQNQPPSCLPPASQPPSAEAERLFQAARAKPTEREQLAGYAQAAELGHERAAARLFSGLMGREAIDEAGWVLAWLLQRQVPAGFNKLADFVLALEGGEPLAQDEESFAQIYGLRWRAARLGNALALEQLQAMNPSPKGRLLLQGLERCSSPTAADAGG